MPCSRQTDHRGIARPGEAICFTLMARGSIEQYSYMWQGHASDGAAEIGSSPLRLTLPLWARRRVDTNRWTSRRRCWVANLATARAVAEGTSLVIILEARQLCYTRLQKREPRPNLSERKSFSFWRAVICKTRSKRFIFPTDHYESELTACDRTGLLIASQPAYYCLRGEVLTMRRYTNLRLPLPLLIACIAVLYTTSTPLHSAFI